ncbi:MAG: hypothetical protein ABI612_17005 [Betaproteobacteria bacterium]
MTPGQFFAATRKLAALLVIPLVTGACAQLDAAMHKPSEVKTAEQTPPSQSPPKRGEFAQFQIKFKADGTPIVVAPDGFTQLRGFRVRLPRKATQVTQLYSVFAVEAKGSHYLVMEVGPGFYMCFDLPHEDGTVGTSCEQPPVQ